MSNDWVIARYIVADSFFARVVGRHVTYQFNGFYGELHQRSLMLEPATSVSLTSSLNELFSLVASLKVPSKLQRLARSLPKSSERSISRFGLLPLLDSLQLRLGRARPLVALVFEAIIIGLAFFGGTVCRVAEEIEPLFDRIGDRIFITRDDIFGKFNDVNLKTIRQRKPVGGA